MKKLSILIISILLVLALPACQSKPQPIPDPTPSSTTQPEHSTAVSSTPSPEAPTIVSSAVQPEAQNYSEVVSPEDMVLLEAKARDYYEEEFPYDLLSLTLVSDDAPEYENYPEYHAGDILIFRTETTHAGEGVFRTIVFAKDAATGDWMQINEGY